jgi:hypothetical protein
MYITYDIHIVITIVFIIHTTIIIIVTVNIAVIIIMTYHQSLSSLHPSHPSPLFPTSTLSLFLPSLPFLLFSFLIDSKTETSESFLLLQNKFGSTSRRTSAGSSYVLPLGQNHMCLLCEKIVHTMESKYYYHHCFYYMLLRYNNNNLFHCIC